MNSMLLIEVQGDYWHGNPDLFNDDGTDGKRMLNEIQIKKKEIDTDIDTDPELKQLSDGIKFMESVYKGETKIEPIKEE